MMNCNRNRQMVKRRIYSFQMDGESRAEAICRAFQQYTLVDWALYDRVSFQIVSSVKHPLLMRELSSAHVDSAVIQGFCPGGVSSGISSWCRAEASACHTGV